MKDWLQQMFSENTKASFGRFGSLIALIMTCIWMTRLVWKVQSYADLASLAIFLGACITFISALYGISKFGDTKIALKKIDAKTLTDMVPANEPPAEAKQ